MLLMLSVLHVLPHIPGLVTMAITAPTTMTVTTFEISLPECGHEVWILYNCDYDYGYDCVYECMMHVSCA